MRPATIIALLLVLSPTRVFGQVLRDPPTPYHFLRYDDVPADQQSPSWPHDFWAPYLNFGGFYESSALRVDAFGVAPVTPERGVFDDHNHAGQPFPGKVFWGLYGAIPVGAVPGLHIDLYYLGLIREDAPWNSGVADETRHSVGTRLWGRAEAWDYDFEGVFQFGDFGSGDIRAWTVASLIVQPLRNFAIKAGVDVLWRYSTRDAFYQPPGVPLVPGSANDKRFLGAQTNLQADWQANAHISVNAAYVHFLTEGFLEDAGARDIYFVGVWAPYKF